MEAAIAGSTTGTRRILENTLENAKKRVTTLDKKIDEAKVERAAEVQAQTAAAVALAAKETKLNAAERETYRGFLEESYFTKKDFGKLEEFYTHSYDRLSEGGKDQMSKRFWEGVRHGEYQFADAPSIMQQKEAERAKKYLGLNELSAKQLSGMSNDEQRAFADAYNSDDRTKAKQVLAHNSSGGNTASSDDSKVDRSSVEDIDLRSVDLKGIKLAEAAGSPSASTLPGASISQVNAR